MSTLGTSGIYCEGISTEWVDVSPAEQAEYLEDLRNRWKMLAEPEKQPMHSDAWAIPRALMQKENDLRTFHRLPRRGQKTLYTNNGWVWNTGTRLPNAIRLLGGFNLSIFRDGLHEQEELLFDVLDIQTTLFICTETLTKIKNMPEHRNLIPTIETAEKRAGQTVYRVQDLLNILKTSKYATKESQ